MQISTTRLTCTFDLTNKSAGKWNVVVTNPDGQVAILADGFTLNATAPVSVFSGTPLTGPFPLTVSFADQSRYNPTSWAWYFGDERYTSNWTQVNDGYSPYLPTNGYCSVALPDGSIVVVGGSAVFRSTDKGTTWTQVTASPGYPTRTGQSAVALQDGSIVVMGGYG